MLKHPEVTVKYDDNGFRMLNKARMALREAGVGQDELDSFLLEALSSTYRHLLDTIGAWVIVEDRPADWPLDWPSQWTFQQPSV